MCCLAAILVFLGPRIGIIIWYFSNPARFDRVFDGWFLPALGWLFLPWTTLMYVSVGIGGVDDWDWLWMGLAVLADIASYAGSGYGNRGRVPASYSSYYSR
jgi:hypothetical protein